jgi:hypothetical protein
MKRAASPPAQDASGKILTKRPPCSHGAACLQASVPAHFNQYSHPCKYGQQCYRKADDHFERFNHPWDPAPPPPPAPVVPAPMLHQGNASNSDDDEDARFEAEEEQRMQQFDRNKSIDDLKRSIRGKAGWSRKIKDKAIASRYVHDAVAQGLSRDAAETAIRELLQFVDLHVDSDHVRHGDGLVPAAVRDTIIRQLDFIADLPNKDWHPGSNQNVQDLIHPSLYCYVEGVSPLLPHSSWNDARRRKALLQEKSKQGALFGRPFEKSSGGYQWLPSHYRISADRHSTIETYINNLDRGRHPELYTAFSQAFDCAIPLLEQVLQRQLRGRTLQVITKACNYVLRPGESHQGNWHVEGMPTEHIVASVIYYYQSSPFLEDDGLAFRRERDEESDFPGVMDYTQDDPPPGGMRDWRNNIELGAVPTPAGRILVFRNDYQHCLTLLHNPSKTEVATRKIVCWFVINPDVPIISTADVPPQQWDLRMRAQGVALIGVSRRVLRGRSLPRDVVLQILERAHIGMSLADARRHREALMKERKVFINDQNKEMEREFSLCEH